MSDKHNNTLKVTINKHELKEAFKSKSQFNDLLDEIIERADRKQQKHIIK